MAKTALPLNKSVFRPLAKTVLISLARTKTFSAVYEGFKKVSDSRTKTLIIQN